MTPEPETFALTDKGQRAMLFVLRWYKIIFVTSLVLAFAAGLGAGWWAHGLMP